jgi:hypothetical protein
LKVAWEYYSKLASGAIPLMNAARGGVIPMLSAVATGALTGQSGQAAVFGGGASPAAQVAAQAGTGQAARGGVGQVVISPTITVNAQTNADPNQIASAASQSFESAWNARLQAAIAAGGE